MPGMKFIALVAITAFLCGCANPINARNGERYYDAGMASEDAGDLQHARKCYSRAHWNAVAGMLGPTAEAYTLYEWSRMTGYLGQHTNAETGFSNVLRLIEKAKPKANALLAPVLCEYARLLHDTGQHEKAVPCFERALPELERREVATKDPIGLADFLDDYAASLRAAGRDARTVAERARSLREPNKGAVAKHKVRRYVTR